MHAGGACGYSDLYEQGYGVNNAALSTALFNDGASCGQCYAIICDSSKTGSCKPGNNWVVVSATNFCPPNDLPAVGDFPAGGWCGPPRPHFDMSQPAWENIGIYSAGIIPVLYQRVKCWKSGGVRFTIAGFNDFYMVLITNVAGSGSIQSMAMKGSNTDWIPMYRTGAPTATASPAGSSARASASRSSPPAARTSSSRMSCRSGGSSDKPSPPTRISTTNKRYTDTVSFIPQQCKLIYPIYPPRLENL